MRVHHLILLKNLQGRLILHKLGLCQSRQVRLLIQGKQIQALVILHGRTNLLTPHNPILVYRVIQKHPMRVFHRDLLETLQSRLIPHKLALH